MDQHVPEGLAPSFAGAGTQGSRVLAEAQQPQAEAHLGTRELYVKMISLVAEWTDGKPDTLGFQLGFNIYQLCDLGQGYLTFSLTHL